MMMKNMEVVLIAARRPRALYLLAAVALAVSACGGGAQTVENPVTSITPPQFYSGPPPANEDVAAFKLNVWDPIQQEATCANCHNQAESQSPMFARTDDVNLAYDAAITAVTLAVPSESLLVSVKPTSRAAILNVKPAAGRLLPPPASKAAIAASA